MAASIAVPIVGWFVSPVISKIVERGDLLLKERSKLEEGVEEEIRRLGVSLAFIRGVLEDAEERQSSNPAVLAWMDYLKESLYDAEDLLDSYAVDLARKEMEATPRIPNAIDRLFLRSRPESQNVAPPRSRLSVAKDIRTIVERLNHISKRARELGLQEIAVRSASSGNSTARQRVETTSSLADDSPVIGRDDARIALKEFLLSSRRCDAERDKLMVLPVVGMGGIGKTTVAKLVFNDADVEGYFELRRWWVCVGVSRQLDLRGLTMEIIDCIHAREGKNATLDFRSLEASQTFLMEEIKEKQPFLLVLDDAWDEDRRTWYQLLEPLKTVSRGSRVIVTTRNNSVANAIPNARSPLHLSCLSEDDMWSIFRRHAFSGESTSRYRRLEVIGRKIVKRLQGLPLAAETIGGILRWSRDGKHWNKILESQLLKQYSNFMLRILKLSYDNLPVNLKQCFPYLSLFPKDYRFADHKEFARRTNKYSYTKDDIVQQWMAHKFFQNENETDSEDIQTDGVVTLLSRSLLQYSKVGIYPFIIMHDLVHDSAEWISKEECFRVSDDTGRQPPKNVRHISYFQKNPNSNILQDLKVYKTLRTLIFNNVNQVLDNPRGILDGWFKSLTCLRVLSLHNSHVTLIPDSIGNLKLLHYLNLFLPKIEKFPETISHLYNLQVLKLRGCKRLRALPNTVNGLVNLKCLDVDQKLLESINGIGKLTNLQELEVFHVQTQEGRKVAELRDLNRLHGSLRIVYVENIESGKNASEAQLNQKKDLEELRLVWCSDKHQEMQPEVLEGLRPSENLKSLSIKHYMGTSLPAWLNSQSLPSLDIVELMQCSNLESFPRLTDFLKMEIINCPRLVNLSILPSTIQHLKLQKVGLTSISAQLDNLGDSFDSSSSLLVPAIYSLPSLQRLEIDNCRNLDGSLSTLLGASVALKYLSISMYKHPLEDLSHLTALSELRLHDCIGGIILDLTALISLEVLGIYNCPSALVSMHRNGLVKPCSAIFRLKIKRSAALMESLSSSRVSLTSLKRLEIDGVDCDNSVFADCFYGLAALQCLVLSNCPNITSISEEVLCKLVATKRLLISHCERLEKLGFQALISLEELTIEACPNLMFNRLPSCPLLEELCITGFHAEQLAGLFSSIACSVPKTIELYSCILSNEGVAFDFGAFSEARTLKTLTMDCCEGLPMQFPSLNFLKKLYIKNCSNITYLPTLSSLENLTISKCHNLTFGDTLSSFSALVYLDIIGFNQQQLNDMLLLVARSPLKLLSITKCDDLTGFVGDQELTFFLPTSLEELTLSYCDKLCHLSSDLQGFTALRHLQIVGCPQLLSLPDEYLPVCLQKLNIEDCPRLEARYNQKEGNDNWKCLSHTWWCFPRSALLSKKKKCLSHIPSVKFS